MMRTKVALLIDSSGSMEHLRTPVRELIDKTLGTLKDAERTTGQVYEVDVYLFGSHLRRIEHVDGRVEYNPTDSCTALLTAVDGAARETEGALKWRGRLRCDAALMIVITDGLNNVPYYGNFARLLHDYQQTDRWTFAFNVPRGHTRNLTGFGVPEGNINEWDQSDRGTQEVEVKTSGGILNYATARGLGRKSVTTFYGTTDASNITPTALAQLDVLSGEYVHRKVNKEQKIKDFTEAVTGSSYVIGATYYQLMKPELVQENKDLLLRDKTTGRLYGGDRVRDYLGIPSGKRFRVNPGNHANFDIFVQSTSVNRILPRGTSVVINTWQNINLPPTWDHGKVKVKAK